MYNTYTSPLHEKEEPSNIRGCTETVFYNLTFHALTLGHLKNFSYAVHRLSVVKR
jgi:hypothetical protein